MGLINWIFDIYQQTRIESLRSDLAQSRADALSVRNSVGGVDTQRLDRAIGELALSVKAIQRIAVEKGICTSAELQQRIQQIDLEDGRADGRAPLPG